MNTPSSPAAQNDIMLCLREETREEHVLTEEAVDILSHLQSVASYRGLLERFYGFYLALGQTDPNMREKAIWLYQDLSALGMSREAIDRIPAYSHVPVAKTSAEKLGYAYVIGGSSLGGQLIARNIRENLGLGPEDGARFFHGHGEETGARWRAFGVEARASAAPEEHGAIVDAAKRMFQAFRQSVGEPVDA